MRRLLIWSPWIDSSASACYPIDNDNGGRQVVFKVLREKRAELNLSG